MTKENIIKLQQDYAKKGWLLELDINSFFDSKGKPRQDYLFHDGVVATLKKDDVVCELVSCGYRKFYLKDKCSDNFNDLPYERIDDTYITNDLELHQAYKYNEIEFIYNGWYELQIWKDNEFLSDGDDVVDDDTFSNIENVDDTIAYILEKL